MDREGLKPATWMSSGSTAWSGVANVCRDEDLEYGARLGRGEGGAGKAAASGATGTLCCEGDRSELLEVIVSSVKASMGETNTLRQFTVRHTLRLQARVGRRDAAPLAGGRAPPEGLSGWGEVGEEAAPPKGISGWSALGEGWLLLGF